MTTIIRAGAAHDFLALVPVLAGYAPVRSLVCVAFEDNRTAAVLRIDLPDAAHEDAAATALLGTLCRIPRVDAVVPIAYGDRPFRDGAVPHRGVLDAVVRRAEDAGFRIRDALAVGSNGWGSLFDEDLPAEGRSLRLIERSAALRTAPAEVAARAAELPDSAAHLVRIPEPAEELAGRIRELRAELDGESCASDEPVGASREIALDRLEHALGDAVDPLMLVERLAAGRGDGSAEQLAWLLELAEQPSIRDAMMLQAAFGPLVGELALDAAEDALARRRAHPADAPSGDGSTVRLPGPDEEETVDAFLSRLILGRSTIRPDVDRVQAVLAAIAPAIGNAAIGSRTGSLCIAAWLAWALGSASAAGALIDLARSETPEHTMAGLLHRFLGLGELPEWAFSAPPGTGRAIPGDDAA
ncbi:DUF4192 family protein [Agromyces sp. GXS1127]|uniref:DUF4192 family protein n=1 Tax=Agromyces sp. GXS1127 TaxID=3424181 RepID=UPI003D32065C